MFLVLANTTGLAKLAVHPPMEVVVLELVDHVVQISTAVDLQRRRQWRAVGS
jgi:hypothetical protein